MNQSAALECAALLWALPLLAQAQTQSCDCTAIVGSCKAQVSVDGETVDVTADHDSCARVDYFVDKQPFVALVAGGRSQAHWAGAANPEVLVQSCQVCRETTAQSRASATTALAAPAAADGLVPLIKVRPRYPDAAKTSGAEGHVEVEFTVDAAGDVTEPHVVQAEPQGVFDAAALAAVHRWRYPAEPGRAPVTLKERLDFSLKDYLFDLEAAPEAGEAAAVAAPQSMNQCVREGESYRSDQAVEVGLISTCEQPLLVFSCAAGARDALGRWSCATSDDSRTVLVRPGERGTDASAQVGRGGNARTYAYAERFSLERAPNSQYWWIACAADDERCSADARQWVRSLEGQLATVDPRGRSALALARSS